MTTGSVPRRRVPVVEGHAALLAWARAHAEDPAAAAALPRSTDAITRWASDVARDPRVMLTVTGSVDGSPADVDSTTGSAALLAADRARALAAAIAGATHARIAIITSQTPGRRAALVTLAFAGERKDRP